MNSLQFNMVAHGIGDISDYENNGQITEWVSKTQHIHYIKLHYIFSK